jgi:hypothetical protein
MAKKPITWGGRSGRPRPALIVDPPAYDPDTEAYRPDEKLARALEIPSSATINLRMRESSILSAGKAPRLIEAKGITGGTSGREAARLFDEARKHLREGWLKRLGTRLGARESDAFAQDADNVVGVFNDNPDREFLQILGGPFSRQLYLSAKLEMYAKAFWEQSHMPLFHRACQMLTEYVVGRGVKLKAKSAAVQKKFDEYARSDNFYRRLWTAHYDLTWQGEVFWRVFVQPDGRVTVREIDGSTIWEAITEPEDVEIVRGYWQQYPSPFNLYSMQRPDGTFVAPQAYFIRILPPDEIIHVRINDTYGEKFGRSDGFSSLGHSKRIRDFSSGITISTMYENAFAWIVKLKGDQGDTSALANRPEFQKVPKPGSLIVHNEAQEWTPASAKGAGGRGSSKSEVMLDLVRLFAAGFGIPVEYLGWIDTGGTKAAAISKTEPFGKHVEARQFWLETQLLRPFLSKLVDVWKRTNQIPADASDEGEWTWPEIEPMDVTERTTQIAMAQREGWITKARAAAMGAAELNITEYDYPTERAEIEKERKAAGDAGMTSLDDQAAELARRRKPMGSEDKAATKDNDRKLRKPADLGGEGETAGAE